jgi:dynein intermediate chain 1
VDELQKVLQFVSVSTDGEVVLWTLAKAELQRELLMRLNALPGMALAPPESPAVDADEARSVLGGLCMDFSKAVNEDHIYLVGTEEGTVHRCSKAYGSDYLSTYAGHSMPVYSVRWNGLHPRMFLSASADWSVKLWDAQQEGRPLMSFDLGDAVGDVAWAPFSATVFAAATDDGKVHVFDLAENRLLPLCSQKVRGAGDGGG